MAPMFSLMPTPGLMMLYNIVLNILVELLMKMREFLPDVLFLQLDNTARENKNKYVLAFLALLVEEGIFSEVWNSYIVRNSMTD